MFILLFERAIQQRPYATHIGAGGAISSRPTPDFPA
jgi:hypothetical protein